ncbi:hypothetical protein [Rahnella aceris]|uniref:Uncharacterized protein n=1 Tax=Rahnella sp. (strain Y9602) TaxID=2703885 RepID=A0ABW6CKA7_RAHSY
MKTTDPCAQPVKTKRTPAEKLVLLCAIIWCGTTWWFFFCTRADTVPTFPPGAEWRYLSDRMFFSLPGWLFTLLPVWCIYLDHVISSGLPTLNGWLRRYGIYCAASLATAFYIFTQRAYPDVVAGNEHFFYLLLWFLASLLCTERCRRN